MGFEIRPAKPGDEALILQLIKELADYEKLSAAVVAKVDTIRENFFGANPLAEAIIAEEDGVPVGFAVFFHNFSTFVGRRGLYLEDLFVRPEFRGKGYGKALLVRVGQIARERGCQRFEWAVLDWNQPAIEFYESLGAKPMSDWIIYRLSGDALKNL